MQKLSKNLCDLVDPYLSKALTMAIFLLISLTAILLENDHFVTFQMVHDFSRNFLSVLAHSDVAISAYHKDIGELNLITCIAFQAMHKQFVILLYFELLPCYCNYCKHDFGKNIFAKIIDFFISNKKNVLLFKIFFLGGIFPFYKYTYYALIFNSISPPININFGTWFNRDQ